MTSAHVSVQQCYTVAHAGRVFTRADYADRVLSPRDFVCGVAVFDRMPSGVFAFVVESKPHPASLSRVFEVPGEAGEITVQLTRGAVLEGVVTDENANPLADATVHTAPHPSMFEPLGFGASPLVLSTRASVRTDREGRYRIEGIAHGKYHVLATHRDHCGVRRDVSVTEDAIYLDNFTMRERIAPHGLSVDLQRLPINVRSVMDFHLAGGAVLANRPYALLGSISGTTPGTPIGTTVLPLVVDGFTGIVMSAFATLPGFLGTFNGSGASTAQFDTQIPMPPFLLGLDIHFAYLTVDTFDAASEPVLVRVTNL